MEEVLARGVGYELLRLCLLEVSEKQLLGAEEGSRVGFYSTVSNGKKHQLQQLFTYESYLT